MNPDVTTPATAADPVIASASALPLAPLGAARPRRSEFLLFSPPPIGEEEIAEVVDTLRSGWITTGPKTARFEAAFREYVGAPGALALNSCTAGLHSALLALGIGPGDEVITTPMTFAATVNVIEHTGATPVLVDVEPDSLTIAADAVLAAVTPRTRAVIPVHFGGHPADLDPLYELARTRDVVIIEDAAHALPAKYHGRTIGSGSNPVSFSFYATKNLTTGEGGMLTGDPELLARARLLSFHGMSRDAWRRYSREGSWFYEVLAPGYKYNMTDIQAALGLAQLAKLERFQRRRREIVSAYNLALFDVPSLELPGERPGVQHAWHLYALRIRPEALTIGRERFIDELTARNIGTSVHFIPVHLHPYYRDRYGYRASDFPVAYSNYRRLVSLPLHPGLGDDDVCDVIEAVLDVARTFAR